MADIFRGAGRCRRHAYGIGIRRGVDQFEPHYGGSMIARPRRRIADATASGFLYLRCGAGSTAIRRRVSRRGSSDQRGLLATPDFHADPVRQISPRSSLGVAAQPDGDEPVFNCAILHRRHLACAAKSEWLVLAGAGDCFLLRRGGDKRLGAAGRDSSLAWLIAPAGPLYVTPAGNV
jgi:hypothetical protein